MAGIVAPGPAVGPTGAAVGPTEAAVGLLWRPLGLLWGYCDAHWGCCGADKSYNLVYIWSIFSNISVKWIYFDTLEVSGGVNTTKLKPKSSLVDPDRPPGPPGPKIDPKSKN